MVPAGWSSGGSRAAAEASRAQRAPRSAPSNRPKASHRSCSGTSARIAVRQSFERLPSGEGRPTVMALQDRNSWRAARMLPPAQSRPAQSLHPCRARCAAGSGTALPHSIYRAGLGKGTVCARTGHDQAGVWAAQGKGCGWSCLQQSGGGVPRREDCSEIALLQGGRRGGRGKALGQQPPSCRHLYGRHVNASHGAVRWRPPPCGCNASRPAHRV